MPTTVKLNIKIQLLVRFSQIVLYSCTLTPQIPIYAAFWATRGGSTPKPGAPGSPQHPGEAGLGMGSHKGHRVFLKNSKIGAALQGLDPDLVYFPACSPTPTSWAEEMEAGKSGGVV